MTTASPLQVLQNYHQDSEAAINRQINLELYAFYDYLSMSCYFDRDDVALRNFAKYFLHQSHEERGHAEKLMKLQNEQGGRIFLQDIKKPDRDDCENGLNAMECALRLCNTRFCVTPSVQFTCLMGALGSFKRRSAECPLFNFGEILIYLAAAQRFPPGRWEITIPKKE
ncbi:Ferritin heavy chain [Lemmus lemmus]